jgi:hypothetical protein
VPPDARRFERYLKSGSGRAFASRHFGPMCDSCLGVTASALGWIAMLRNLTPLVVGLPVAAINNIALPLWMSDARPGIGQRRPSIQELLIDTSQTENVGGNYPVRCNLQLRGVMDWSAYRKTRAVTDLQRKLFAVVARD